MTDRRHIMLTLTAAVVARMPVVPCKRADLDANMDYIAAWADAFERRLAVEAGALALVERDRESYVRDQADMHAKAVAGGKDALRFCGCDACVGRKVTDGK